MVSTTTLPFAFISMKKSYLLLWPALFGAVAMNSVDGATTDLPASAKLPLGSSTTRGFLVRVREALPEPLLANNQLRAFRQLNDTLTDAAGAPVSNIADPGPLARGAFGEDLVSYERDGLPVDLLDPDNNVLATFNTLKFPGPLHDSGDQPNLAVEVVGFLELPAGVTTFGVSVSADRTDVNDDDGYVVYTATNPNDFFGLKIGEYERNAKPFVGNQRNENL